MSLDGMCWNVWSKLKACELCGEYPSPLGLSIVIQE